MNDTMTPAEATATRWAEKLGKRDHMRLVAEVNKLAESEYRRGYAHGAVVGPTGPEDQVEHELCEWRHAPAGKELPPPSRFKAPDWRLCRRSAKGRYSRLVTECVNADSSALARLVDLAAKGAA